MSCRGGRRRGRHRWRGRGSAACSARCRRRRSSTRAGRVRADLERAEREEVVTGRLVVLVEQHGLGRGVGAAAATVDRVVAALDGAADVPPAVRCAPAPIVRLLDPRLDLVEQLGDEAVVARQTMRRSTCSRRRGRRSSPGRRDRAATTTDRRRRRRDGARYADVLVLPARSPRRAYRRVSRGTRPVSAAAGRGAAWPPCASCRAGRPAASPGISCCISAACSFVTKSRSPCTISVGAVIEASCSSVQPAVSAWLRRERGEEVVEVVRVRRQPLVGIGEVGEVLLRWAAGSTSPSSPGR